MKSSKDDATRLECFMSQDRSIVSSASGNSSAVRYLFSDVPADGKTITVAPGVKWLRMPLPLALDHINLYLIANGDGWMIVDCGMKGGITRKLWQQVFDTELEGKPINAVLSTHMHPDHIGQAGWLVGLWQVPFYMTFGEYFMARTYTAPDEKIPEEWRHDTYAARTGMPVEFVEKMRKGTGGFGSIVEPLPRSYKRLQDGQILTLGDQRWQVIIGRGHSPEHACLYNPALNILISGDQILPQITSNVSVTSTEPDANPLQEWMQSLQRLMELPDDALVCPAHNAPFFGLHARLRELLAHHEQQLASLEAVLATPKTAYELLPTLFRRELHNEQLMMAMGECLAHLHLLLARGAIEQEFGGDGIHHYRAVSVSLPPCDVQHE
jgi:glyoxylase-like metal-dependent hydrolase (beta-lactamase superfamily II)